MEPPATGKDGVSDGLGPEALLLDVADAGGCCTNSTKGTWPFVTTDAPPEWHPTPGPKFVDPPTAAITKPGGFVA